MIVKAAVVIFDCRQDFEIVIPCHRHCDAFQILKDFGYSRDDFKEISQGFLDEHDNYYTRTEAYTHAVACGQIPRLDDKAHNELYSEDLY